MKSDYRQLLVICSLACIASLFQLISCGPPKPQEGGKFEPTPNLEYNPRVISPIVIVPPLLACGKSVTIKGFVPGARIRVYADGAIIGDADGWDSEGQTFAVAPDLAKAQTIYATQEFEGAESVPSASIFVQDHSEVYPAGLPKPIFPHPYLYDCGVATVVGELPPGGSVKVLSGPPASVPIIVIGQADGVAAWQGIGIGPPFKQNHLISAVSQICSDVSPRADEQVVHPAPTTLPTPEVTAIYPGGMIISIHKLVNGASVIIKRGGTVISGGGAPGSHVSFPMRVPVSAGDVLEIIQELCGVSSPPGTVTVQPCSALPPAKILAPRAGDDVIYLSDVVRGSRIRIFSGGQEIGDGGGSAIQLTRPLVDNEILIVVQSVGTCISSTSNVVQVGHGLDDPLTAGPCGRVLQFEYGHPTDPERQTTDVTPYFNSSIYGGLEIPNDSIPLHGLVRYPDGPGPFPLVIIVHGNHNPKHPSYPGYNYLLDHFASHCMIAVSIEEDFFNGPVGGEMEARGIVLLRHLQLWREWTRTPGHRFYGKVQESSIGLAGHSRGGEAIAIAKDFNHTLHNPADPAHNFNFQIRALFAIAPVDGYNYGTPPIVLNGADYYVMHGSHDGDLCCFYGHQFYDRAFPVNGSTNNFKGLLYVYGANHGHWNSQWTPSDESQVAPVTKIISEADQKLIGKSYMTAFFLASLKGWPSYRYFLNGDATFTSLPSSVTRVFQYQDPKRIFLNHYEEDNNVATGSQPGVTNSTSGTFVKYVDYKFSDGPSGHFLWEETDGLIAGWRNENAEIHVTITGEFRKKIPDYEFLAFRIAQTMEDPVVLNTPGVNKDLSVQMSIGSVAGPEVRTSSYQPLPYPMVTPGATKSVMQTIRIPLRDLVNDPRHLANISKIILKFNRHATGIVAMDELQFTD